MNQASENATRFATRPDPIWQGFMIRLAINNYQEARTLDPANEPEHAAILYFTLLEITDRAERHNDQQLPEPPVNARLITIVGKIYPLELGYRGQDQHGFHIWQVVNGIDFDPVAGDRIKVDRIPPRTSIAFPIHRLEA